MAMSGMTRGAGAVLLAGLLGLGCSGSTTAGMTGPEMGAAVGAQECVLSTGACPAECSAVRGQRLDRGRSCLGPQQVLTCSRAQGGTGGLVCAARSGSGEVFLVSGGPLVEPDFRGWRACTEEEGAALRAALSRTCPG
jgi:hypothetical protein